MKRNLAKLVVVFAASGLIALADDAEGSFGRALTVSGPVDLGVQTGAGPRAGTVTISRIEDGVRLHTGSGRVELDSIQGNVDAHTGSGPIHGTGIKGRIVADTGSGGIHLEQTGAADIEARAGSGEITLRVPQ